MRYHSIWQACAIREDGASDFFPSEVPGNVQRDYGRYMGWGGRQCRRERDALSPDRGLYMAVQNHTRLFALTGGDRRVRP